MMEIGAMHQGGESRKKSKLDNYKDLVKKNAYIWDEL